jgi:hypothetical protein
MLPSYLFGTALTCHFGTSMQCAQQPRGSPLCGFHVTFHMLRLLDNIHDIKKAAEVDNNAQPCLCSYYPSDFRK